VTTKGPHTVSFDFISPRPLWPTGVGLKPKYNISAQPAKILFWRDEMKKITWILVGMLFIMLWPSMSEAKPPETLDVTPIDIKTVAYPVHPQGGPKDEIYIYGGPETLEGKFETEDGDPDRQGWTSHDLSVPEDLPDEFQIDTFYCANLDPETVDNHAYWCGDHYPICPPSVVDGGYGDSINAGLEWEIVVPEPGVSIQGTLEFALNHNLEAAYDFVHVEYYSASSDTWIWMADYTGLGYGLNETINFNIDSSAYTVDDKLRLRFRVSSDGYLLLGHMSGDQFLATFSHLPSTL